MSTGKGQVFELILDNGDRHARISCPPNLVPMPGQYLLASDGSDSSLPVPLFYTDSAPQGFIAAAPVPDTWNPGTKLHLRGPLGRGFTLPLFARKVAIVVFEAAASRLKGLIQQGLKQDAAVVLVCDSAADDLPDDVEVQPLSALGDIVEWADYVAFDVARENLPPLRKRLGKQSQLSTGMRAQILIRTAIPCGGLAECGVCAVVLKSEWKLACKDGPVFDWRELE